MLRRIELRISYIKMVCRCRLLTARQEREKNIVNSRFLYHFISLPSFRWFPFISPSSKLITHGTCNFEQRETLHLSSWKLLTGSTNDQVTWHVCNWNSSNSLKSDIIEEKWCWFPFKTPFFSTFTFKVSSFHLCKYCLINTIHVKLPDALFSNEVGHQIKSGIYLINFIIKSIRERLRLANVKLHVTNLPNKFAVRISIVWHTK